LIDECGCDPSACRDVYLGYNLFIRALAQNYQTSATSAIFSKVYLPYLDRKLGEVLAQGPAHPWWPRDKQTLAPRPPQSIDMTQLKYHIGTLLLMYRKSPTDCVNRGVGVSPLAFASEAHSHWLLENRDRLFFDIKATYKYGQTLQFHTKYGTVFRRLRELLAEGELVHRDSLGRDVIEASDKVNLHVELPVAWVISDPSLFQRHFRFLIPIITQNYTPFTIEHILKLPHTPETNGPIESSDTTKADDRCEATRLFVAALAMHAPESISLHLNTLGFTTPEARYRVIQPIAYEVVRQMLAHPVRANYNQLSTSIKHFITTYHVNLNQLHVHNESVLHECARPKLAAFLLTNFDWSVKVLTTPSDLTGRTPLFQLFRLMSFIKFAPSQEPVFVPYATALRKAIIKETNTTEHPEDISLLAYLNHKDNNGVTAAEAYFPSKHLAPLIFPIFASKTEIEQEVKKVNDAKPAASKRKQGKGIPK